MDRRRHTTSGAPWARIGFVLILASLASCAARPRFVPQEGVQGVTGVEAVFQGRQLRADLPCYITVPSAAAAAERVLSRRGLTISHREVDHGSALILGTPPGADPDDLIFRQRTRVNIQTEGGCCAVRILVEPFGSEPESRTILEQMLFELGL
ncbi:MAG: hypothetical protein ACF8Q5_07375 [Phycisphaerales bacterium JB040]